MEKYYVIKKTVLETYGIVAKNRKEALEIMKSGKYDNPGSVTVLKQTLVKLKE